MYGPQPPKPKYRYTAPVIMLVAAAAAAFFGYDEMRKYTDNPDVTELACGPDVLERAGDRKWVAVPDCLPDFDDAYEVTDGARVEGIYIPLHDAKGQRAGLLFTKDSETLDLSAQLRTATAEGEERDAAEKLAAKITGAGLTGMTDEIRRDHVDLMARNLPGISRDTLVLDHLDAPNRATMWFGWGVAGLLGVLGTIFFLRARKLSALDAAERLAWHQAQAAQQTARAAPQFGAPQPGYGAPPMQAPWGVGPGQYPPGQYPPGQYPPGQYPPQ